MSAVLPLLSIALMLLSVPSESLKCYQCMDEASCAYGQANSVIDCSGQCMTYRKTNEDSKEHLWIEPKSLNPSSIQSGIVIRRCCSTACEMKEEVREHMSMDSCSEDRCNGIQSDGTLVGTVIHFYLSGKHV